MQAARNKDACEAKRQSIEHQRQEQARLEAEHAQAEAGLDELQSQLTLLRQKREGLQQEAAQVTAELAGLEERRRGAEAASSASTGSMPTLVRRVPIDRAAADGRHREEREQRHRPKAPCSLSGKRSWPQSAVKLWPLPQTHRRPVAGRAPAVGGDGDRAQDRPCRARSTP